MRMIGYAWLVPGALWFAVFSINMPWSHAFIAPATKIELDPWNHCMHSSRRPTLYATVLETKKETGIDLERAFKDGEKLLEGKSCLNGVNFNFTQTDNSVEVDSLLPNAPHLTFQKFLTMQEKRVVVTFRYTDLPYLKPYFLTFASKLKKKHSDIIIEKKKLPVSDGNLQPHFEVIVDGKTVMGGGGKGREHVLGGRVDVLNTQSVFVSMEQISLAIAKARKKRRPTTLYGEGDDDDDMDSDTPIRRLHRSYVRRNGLQKQANE